MKLLTKIGTPSNHSRPLGLLLVVGLALSTAWLPAQQYFQIEHMELDAQGRFRLTHQADTNHYYLLLRGETVTAISEPTVLIRGQSNQNIFLDPEPAALRRASFYRVQSLPLTAGAAVDVTALNDLVFVADSQAGVAIYDASNALSPRLLAQVDTPGTALGVACAGSLLAVADGDAGLAVINLTPSFGPRRVQQIGTNWLGGGTVQAVAAADDLCFVGTTAGVLSLLQLSSGAVLQSTNLGGRVEDLAIEGTTLYAWANGRVHAVGFAHGVMDFAGSVACPGTINGTHGRGRLFVGHDLAYAVHRAGYNTFNFADPANPTLIAQGNTSRLGWKQIVLNGNGLGLAAVGQGESFSTPQTVSLYNTSDPAVTGAFLTEFTNVRLARAVAIYRGTGFAACDTNGLRVVEYLPPDTNSLPPTITLATSSPDGTAMEGTFVVVRATTSDDVQVSAVEFWVNGQRALLDGSFPFELVYRVPWGKAGQTLTFTALAFDTGGNRAESGPVSVTVTADEDAPVVNIDSPADGQVFFEGDDVPVRLRILDSVDGLERIVGVESVTFRIDSQAVPARRLSLNDWVLGAPAVGWHTLLASARDWGGQVGHSLWVSFYVSQQAISPEFSVFNAGKRTWRNEVVGRDFSLFNAGPRTPFNEVLSREISFFNAGTNTVFTEALSRELSVLNTTNAP